MKDHLEAQPVAATVWPVRPLGKVARFLGGGTPSKNRSEYWNGDIPWVSPKDMKSDVVSDSLDKITPQGVAGSAAKLIPADSLLIVVRSGILARTVPTALSGRELTINQDLKAICPSRELHPRFLAYFMRAAEGEILATVSRGATVHRLSTDVLKSLEIPLPPLEEQKRIVAVLDQAFAALDRARAHAEASLADSTELFDAWLTAVFHDHPSTWETQKLRDLCHQITVGHVGPMANRYVESGTPFLRSQNVRPFEINLDDVKFIDDGFREELRKSELRPGDVAIVRTGYPGTAAVIPDSLPLANCADLVIARPSEVISPQFLAMFLNSTFGKSMVASKTVGAAQKHFNVGAAKEVEFSFPLIEEQNRIVEQAERMRTYAGRLASGFAAKLASITNLRASLLQQAFAGRLT